MSVKIRVALGLLAWMCPGSARAQDQPQTEVVGVTIAAVDKDSEYEQSLIPGTQPGTQVYVRVKLPGQYILELDDAGQKVQLTDQAGKDLKTRDAGGFSFFANIGEDHQSVTIPISGESVPPAGTEHLALKGEASIICGSGLTEKVVDVKLAESEAALLGKTNAKITSVGAGFEENSAVVEFESDSAFNTIKELRFVDANGQEHVAQARGSGRFGFGGNVTYSQSYEFPAAADSIKSAKVSYFEKVETIKVPIDLQIGLSLGK